MLKAGEIYKIYIFYKKSQFLYNCSHGNFILNERLIDINKLSFLSSFCFENK